MVVVGSGEISLPPLAEKAITYHHKSTKRIADMWPFKPNIRKMIERKNVKGLIKALGGTQSSDEAEPIVQVLADIGFPALNPLIATLQGEDEHTAYWVCDALGRMGKKEAVAPLIEALNKEEIRGSAAHALGKLGDNKAVEPLIAALRRTLNEGELGLLIIGALGELGDLRAADALYEAAISGKSYTASDAEKALWKLGTSVEKMKLKKESQKPERVTQPENEIGIFNLLVQLNNNDDEFAREELLKILRKTKEKFAISVIKKAVAELYTFKAQWLIPSLGELKDDSVRIFLEEVIKKYDQYEERDILDKALQALTKVCSESAFQLIEEMLENSSWVVRDVATRALVNFLDKPTTNEMLKKMINDDCGYVRKAATKVIGELSDLSFLPLLKNALKDKYRSGCLAAIALGKLRDKTCIHELKELLRDEEPSIRRDVVLALGLIGDPSIYEPLDKPIGLMMGPIRAEFYNSVYEALKGLRYCEGPWNRDLAEKALKQLNK